jgi:hypothetical protein
VRIYFRPPGCKAVPLPGPIGSPEFMEAYNSAIAEPLPKAGIPVKSGTLAALSVSYLNSATFNEKRPETQRTERGIINRLVEQYGAGKVSDLKHEQVQRIIDKRTATPSAARNLLAVIRVLMDHAIKIKLLTRSPAVGIDRPNIKGKGFRAWKDEHCALSTRRHIHSARGRDWHMSYYPALACAAAILFGLVANIFDGSTSL